MFIKVIACEIALREICHQAARSRNIVDLEFLPQGYHDIPTTAVHTIQKHIDAVPEGKYDAVILGYGLCGNIIKGLKTSHTKLVIPRAHDCITFFLGSCERYNEFAAQTLGSFYYTSGWLECLRRRGEKTAVQDTMYMPTQAGANSTNIKDSYAQWVERYGEEQANYLMETMEQWTQHYTRGILIDFDFTKDLTFREQAQAICAKRGWQYDEVRGDMSLIATMLDGPWDDKRFLILNPGEEVEPAFDDRIISAKKLNS